MLSLLSILPQVPDRGPQTIAETKSRQTPTSSLVAASRLLRYKLDVMAAVQHMGSAQRPKIGRNGNSQPRRRHGSQAKGSRLSTRDYYRDLEKAFEKSDDDISRLKRDVLELQEDKYQQEQQLQDVILQKDAEIARQALNIDNRRAEVTKLKQEIKALKLTLQTAQERSLELKETTEAQQKDITKLEETCASSLKAAEEWKVKAEGFDQTAQGWCNMYFGLSPALGTVALPETDLAGSSCSSQDPACSAEQNVGSPSTLWDVFMNYGDVINTEAIE